MATIFKRHGKSNRSGKYYASWFDHRGKRQTRSTGTTDAAAARRIANKLEAESALRREGVIDPSVESVQLEANRSIESHLADFENKLRSAGRCEHHINETLGAIRKFATATGAALARDITGDAVTRYAVRLADGGNSARTIQKHIGSIKALTRWLAAGSKLERDPLASLATPRPETDRRLQRRAMLPAEWESLKRSLANGPVRHGMSAAERITLYWTAIETGLRAGELRSLRRGNLHLSGSTPFITVAARSTKNRQAAKQYVSAGLAAELEKLAQRKHPAAPLFPMPRYGAKMFRADLADARAAWIAEANKDPQESAKRRESDFLAPVDQQGERLDFHSLRVTCATWLALAGERPQVIQSVMRHSVITLTMGTYARLFDDDRSGAVPKLNQFVGQLPEVEPLRATGTAGAEIQPIRERSARRSSQCAKGPIWKRGEVAELETECVETTIDAGEELSGNCGSHAPECDAARQEESERRRWESNPRWRICNPLP